MGAARADALIDIAARYLRQPGERRQRQRQRCLINIVAEARVLEAPDQVDGVCETEAGVGLDPRVVRGLACTNPTVTMVEDQVGRMLDVGRRTRRPNRALRRALARRERGCVYPGCTARRTQAHHIKHWIDGGPTTIENLASLCKAHHRALHLGKFAIQHLAGGWRFTRADGEPVPAASPLGPTDRADAGVEPASATCTPDWDGGRLYDLSGIVDGLLRQEGLLTEPPLPPRQPDTPILPGADTSPIYDPRAPTGVPTWSETWRDPWSNLSWPGE